MKTVRDLLRDADPLRHEPHQPEWERDRLLQTIVAEAADVAAPLSARLRAPVALLATVAAIVIGVAAVGSLIWLRGGATVQAAAIRFEVRLAEDHPVAGLREAPIAGSNGMIYLHREIIVTNDDIERSSVVPGDRPSRFGIGVQFNGAGAEKMSQATANHIGRPVAILIDGEVVAAPVLRGAISASAEISGDFTRAEAQRIVNGISMR